MRISTLGYVGKQGVKNIGRNKMFSIASIATMSACIFLFGLFFSIVLNLQHFVKTAEEGVAMHGTVLKKSTLETIRNWQMDLRMTIRLQAPAVMRFI